MSASSTDGPPIAGPAPVPPPLADDGMLTWRAVEYAVVPGYRPLLLDVVRPDSDAELPLVVFIHGGGWSSGSRGRVGPMYADWSPGPFAQLAAHGVAVASLDYRLSAEARFPAALDDVRAGLRWLGAHADEFGLAPRRVGLWGESAGAHLAALAGLTGTGVDAVVDWYGPTDLTAMPGDATATGISITRPGDPDSRESQLLGASAGDRPDLARAASPVAHVGPDAPPFLIAHGSADRFVPVRQSERLADALTAAGHQPRLHRVPGADHLWLGDPDAARRAFDDAARFLAVHLH